VYELDASLRPIRHYYLGNPEEIAAKMAAEAAQGAAKK
jgi:2,3-bisphosphoglycerate-dependent phosphoglycerate mutase